MPTILRGFWELNRAPQWLLSLSGELMTLLVCGPLGAWRAGKQVRWPVEAKDGGLSSMLEPRGAGVGMEMDATH